MMVVKAASFEGEEKFYQFSTRTQKFFVQAKHLIWNIYHDENKSYSGGLR